ncbi:MAG: T9SS type A sorting domain-containing protein [Bacteroidota bacterium]
MRALLLLLLAALAVVPPSASAQPLSAESLSALDYRPLMLTGPDLAPLLAAASDAATPEALRAYAYVGGAWQLIPVQTLERVRTDLAFAYPAEVRQRSDLDPDAIDDLLLYADPSLLIGADPDPRIDEDDQVLLLPSTFGLEAPNGSVPAGVEAADLVRVRVADPLGGVDRVAYLALAPDAPPVPDAGVRYDYRPDSDTYDYIGTNPEQSVVTTPYYERHFRDRWIEDRFHVRLDPADPYSPDLLDRRRMGFEPTSCARTEKTASESRGAPVANVCGPVACLRSVVGFNSGPLTQLTYLFFPRYTETRIDLRVHPVPGVSFWRDWAPITQGATYVSNLFPDGVPLDGQPDAVEGSLDWDALLFAQGSVVSSWRVDANVPQWDPEAIWLDEENPELTPCTGDEAYYGASGSFVRTTVAVSTDPRDPGYRLLGSTSRTAVAPRLNAAEAAALGEALGTELDVSVDANAVDAEQDRPASAALDVALYPNPTAGTTTLRLTLDRAQDVTVRVFDVLGREVARTDAALGAGTQTLTLPTDALAPGTYAVRLDAADGVATKRLSVI